MKPIPLIVTIAIIASSIVAGMFVNKFGIGYWDSVEKWAQTGDFFGGILNPIFAFLSLILIAYTLLQNKKALEQSNKAIEQSKKALQQNEKSLSVGNQELKLSREEYSKSVSALNSQVEQFNFHRFENTFFNMLSLQNEILNELEFSDENLTQFHNYWKESTKSRKVFSSILRWIDYDDESEEKDVLLNYDLFQVRENQVVGHYFRNLYQVFKLIDESELCLSVKEKYAGIVRAQLSADEIAVLFFNCISPKVDDGKFREYVIKYTLLEHLVIDPYLHIDSIKISTQAIDVSSEYFEKYVKKDSNGNILKSAFGTNPSMKIFSVDKI